MKKIIILMLVSLTFLTANNDNNESNRSCGSIEVKGCFDSNFMSKLLTTVCEKGKMEACYNLGLMYAQGEGITKNKAKAIELFQKACDGGIEEGCENYKILTTCEE
ncbi:MAG: Unknown protein [uncultured Sulfurovum sp.]|uniref:beta-lactamase n=1 Tax=uncultured Sulfurovum sp. TaxID=269237 RepID=A0A6S6T2P1_9BACT|nr:MAG: Unknown protein [uncultured Sulfurovum sp.]